jgi:hypothetical protein
LAFLHGGEERVRNELFLLHAARHVLAFPFDEREAQIVLARTKIHKALIHASASQRAHLLARQHLEDLFLASNLLALAVDDTPSELRVAFAQIQSSE